MLFNAGFCTHFMFFTVAWFVEEYVVVLREFEHDCGKCIYFVMLTMVTGKLRLVKSMDTLIDKRLLTN